MTATNENVLERIKALYEMLYRHDGFGEMRIEVRILRRGQKEIIIHCGKQYRYVVDREPPPQMTEADLASRSAERR